jgi:hypothetical protein
LADVNLRHGHFAALQQTVLSPFAPADSLLRAMGSRRVQAGLKRSGMTSVAASAGSTAAEEWRSNWPIVFTAFLGNLLLSLPVLSMEIGRASCRERVY